MKGLFLTDLFWLKNQKRLLVITGLLSVFYLALKMESFLLSFEGLFCSFILQKTISVNLSPTSGPFFLTLPFSFKDYAFEKYLICLGLPLLVEVVLAGLCLLLGTSWTVIALSFGASALGMMILCGLMIPLTIRFHENSSFYMMSSAAVWLMLFAGISMITDGFSGLETLWNSAWQPWLLAGAALLLAGFMAGSFLLSIRWLKKQPL